MLTVIAVASVSPCKTACQSHRWAAVVLANSLGAQGASWMSTTGENTETPVDRIDAIRAFYEFASLSGARRHPRAASRALPRPAAATRAIFAALASGKAAPRSIHPCRRMRNVSGREARAHGARSARDRDRRQRNKLAPHARSSTQTRRTKFAAPPACDRAHWGAWRDVRPDRLHGRASPLERSGHWSSLAA